MVAQKGQRVKKSPRIHPPGTINAHTVHNNANGVGCLHGPRDIAILGLHYEEFCKWVTWQCSAVTPEGTSFNLTTSVTSKQTVPNVIVRHLRGAVQLLHQRPRGVGGTRGALCYRNAASPSPSITISGEVPSDCFALAAVRLLFLSFNVGTRPDTNEDRLLSFFCRCGIPPPPPNHKAEAS